MRTILCQMALLFILLMTVGCYRHHLYVQQEWVDRNFLASSHVNTPDPRQTKPPTGQRLLVAWDFPRSLYQKELSLEVSVRFWDDTQRDFHCLLQKKRGYTSYFFEDEKILTYRVRVITKDGEVVDSWKHHFWTELIDVGKPVVNNNSSISSQPIQGSVIDTP